MFQPLKFSGKIESGYQLRTAINPVVNGFFDVVRLSEVSENGINAEGLLRLDLDIDEHEYRIYEGDVLFRSRGGNYKSAVVGKLSRPTIALSPLYIYKNADPTINSEFICWWLNLPETQAKIEDLAVGSNIKSIPFSEFVELQVPVISFELQAQIVEIDRLNRQERVLELALAEKRAGLVERTLIDAVKSAAAGIMKK